jgi:DNA-binding CsgD family transcriptional regulator
MGINPGVEVVSASYRSSSLATITGEVLPALAATTNACFAFFHHGASCEAPTVVTWPPRADVLDRYKRDYVADCPFVPIKLASREWVLPITRRLSRRQLAKTAFYADLLRPAGLEHHVELRLEPSPEHGLPLAGIMLCRDKRAGEFSDQDLGTLASLRAVLTSATRRVVELDRALERIDALEAMLAPGDLRAVRLAVDADGHELHLHAPAGRQDDALLKKLRDASHPLRRLAHDVARGVRISEHVHATSRPVAGDHGAYWAEVALVARNKERRPIALLTLTMATKQGNARRDWGLSRTETAVLSEIAAGHSNEKIGKRLFISPDTVRTHLTRIYRKMGVRSRLEAAALARSS